MAETPPTPLLDGEANTSSRGPEAPKREKSLERDYPAGQRHGGENRTDAEAPTGPVNIPVKK